MNEVMCSEKPVWGATAQGLASYFFSLLYRALDHRNESPQASLLAMNIKLGKSPDRWRILRSEAKWQSKVTTVSCYRTGRPSREAFS